MVDHGVLFAVGDDAGPTVRVPVDDVRDVMQELTRAPGGLAESPEAVRALELLQTVTQGREDVRHWVIEQQIGTAIVWALDRMGRLSDPLVELRGHLLDTAT